jgi:hypothetical protein
MQMPPVPQGLRDGNNNFTDFVLERPIGGFFRVQVSAATDAFGAEREWSYDSRPNPR